MIKIIFLCHGNICRSIAAECYGRQLIKNLHLDNSIQISSRALSDEEEGNGIYPSMREALIRNEIEIIKHHSTMVTQKEFDEADYVFYMDNNNRRWLSSLLNNYSKAKIISCYQEKQFEIEDPWYSHRYDYVLSSIKKCVDSIITNITKERLNEENN